MAEWNDYKDVLAGLCWEIKPDRVFEWGPGKSTELMGKLCQGAEIVSIENEAKWYREAVHKYSQYAQIYHAVESYVSWPLLPNKGKFDLIFIDGRRRVECMIAAFLCLNKGGAIVLHDAERDRYKPGIDALCALGMAMSGTKTTRVFK